MSTITELEAALRGTAPQVDADTDGEDVEAFLPERRTVTFDRSPKRPRVGAAPPATPPHAPRPRPPAPATPEMRPAPAVTQSPPGPPTAGGSSSDDESVPAPAPRRKWAPPTAGFSSSDDEDEAPARPADDDTDDGDDAPAAAPPVPAPAPAAPTPQAQQDADLLARLDRDAQKMEMPPLLLAAYNGDASVVGLLLTRGDPYDQVTARNNQNVLHLAAGPGDERLAFVVAFLDYIGFDWGCMLALQKQKDGVLPMARARQNRHRHVAELCEALVRGDREAFDAKLDEARRLVPFEPPQSPPAAPPRAPVVARWVEAPPPPPRRRRRAPSPDSSDGDDGDSSIEWGPVIPAPARRAPPRPIPEGKEIIEIE
jgi:hypothetical protein